METQETDCPLADNIRRIRKLKGWTQQQLSEKAGTWAIAGIESGARTHPSYDTVAAIAKALDVDAKDLYVRLPARRKKKSAA